LLRGLEMPGSEARETVVDAGEGRLGSRGAEEEEPGRSPVKKQNLKERKKSKAR
jgi:hypothetical protein